MKLNDAQKLELEGMLDRTSVQDLLDSLSEIALGKASHIEENWQDLPLARTWTKLAKDLDKLAYKYGGM